MPKNKLDDLRNHLFEVIEKLKDGDINIDTAKAIKGVGDTIINSAKIELQFLQMTKNTGIKSNFMPLIETTAENTKFLTGGEMEDCKCGSTIYPADADKSTLLHLDYPRCSECLSLLPENLDIKKANAAGR